MEYKGTGFWAVYDQQLIEQAMEENRWPKELAEKITEDKRLFIDELMDDLFGLRRLSGDGGPCDSAGARRDVGHGKIVECVSHALDWLAVPTN
ncbi:MAG TPA: hypothetical protein VFC44_21665 [Candidatus Saccharimonadales bacterium]|nr:hypothetical protein [Candidatus Saccharimonadales bacterium]